MEIEIIKVTAYKVISPLGTCRCFTREGVYRALAKRMILNKPRWKEYMDKGYLDDDDGYIYKRKLKLQRRLARYLKYIYPLGG